MVDEADAEYNFRQSYAREVDEVIDFRRQFGNVFLGDRLASLNLGEDAIEE